MEATMADFQVRYVPSYIEKTIAGAKGPKQFGRPYLMDIRTFMVQPSEDKTICSTFLLFGGIPQPKMHNMLTDADFKLRRVNGSWKNKKGEEVQVDDTDNSCWAVYYTTGDFLSEAQIKVIAHFHKLLSKVVEKQKSFLLPTWAQVDRAWTDRDTWLKLVVYKEESASPATATGEDDDGLLSEDDFGDIDDDLI